MSTPEQPPTEEEVGLQTNTTEDNDLIFADARGIMEQAIRNHAFSAGREHARDQKQRIESMEGGYVGAWIGGADRQGDQRQAEVLASWGIDWQPPVRRTTFTRSKGIRGAA